MKPDRTFIAIYTYRYASGKLETVTREIRAKSISGATSIARGMTTSARWRLVKVEVADERTD